MKKLILLFLNLVIVFMAATSCEEDDNELEGDSDTIKEGAMFVDAYDVYYNALSGSHLYYSTSSDNIEDFNGRPVYSQYAIYLEHKIDPEHNPNPIFYINVNSSDFGKGFTFSKENTSIEGYYELDGIYLLSKGSAKVTAFDKNKNCTTEFNNCVFTDIYERNEIKINGKLTIKVRQ